MVKLRAEDLEDGDTITAAQFRKLVGADEGWEDAIQGVEMAPKIEKSPRKHPERDFQREVIEVARSFGWTDFGARFGRTRICCRFMVKSLQNIYM